MDCCAPWFSACRPFHHDNAAERQPQRKDLSICRVSTPSRASARRGVTAATLGTMAASNVYRARKTEREYSPNGSLRYLSTESDWITSIEVKGSPYVLLHGNVVTVEVFLDKRGVVDHSRSEIA